MAGCMMMPESRPSTSSRRWTKSRHHACLMLLRSSDTERATVEAVIAAVDLGGRENEAAAFAQADEFFHEVFAGLSCHKGAEDVVC